MAESITEIIARAIYARDADAARPDWIEYADKARERYREIAQAALTALAEAGYAIAPVEPTEAMLDAGFRPVGVLINGRKVLRGQWSAMITAALDSEKGE